MQLDVWRLYWTGTGEWGGKRPCLSLLDLNKSRLGWMERSCVIAVDALNEGYQSVQVWHESEKNEVEKVK